MSKRLVEHLQSVGAKRLYFAGALTKACVMFSANSAFTLGFEGNKGSNFQLNLKFFLLGPTGTN